jgi:serine/threonine protein kinase
MSTNLDTLLVDDRRHVTPPNFTNETCSIIALGIAAGLACLHSRGIVHCDIKPGNILLDSDLRPKIGDFGLAKLISLEPMSLSTGTLIYKAPEWLNGTGTPNGPIDVYAYGILLYELFTRNDPYPFQRESESFSAAVIDGMRPDFSEADQSLPAPLVQLIRSCWGANPAARPTFQKILEERDKLKVGDGDFVEFERYWRKLKEPQPQNEYWVLAKTAVN